MTVKHWAEAHKAEHGYYPLVIGREYSYPFASAAVKLVQVTYLATYCMIAYRGGLVKDGVDFTELDWIELN